MEKSKESTKYTVSVIVPAYNTEKTIERCIDSLINQTFTPTEIIVVDDGSTDNTGIVLNQYSQTYNNITVIHQKNAGVSAARNRGLLEASSDHVMFVDSDDMVGKNYINTLMQYANYDYVTCGFHMQKDDSSWDDVVFTDEEQRTNAIRRHPSIYLGKYYFGSPWAKLFKREIIESNGLRFSTDIHSGEDIIFNFNYLTVTDNIRIFPLCDYYYYYQKSSLSHSNYYEIGEWTLVREKLINDFFDCDSESEKCFLYDREFDILQQLLQDNCKNWNNQKISELYNDPLFRNSVKYKRKNGKIGEKLLSFSLDNNIYNLYKTYHWLKRIIKPSHTSSDQIL